MRMSPLRRSSAFAIFCLPLAAATSPVCGNPLAAGKTEIKTNIDLVPHRAVYDLSLAQTRAGSGVGGVRGRLVLEFLGSDCHGYTLNTRLVTEVTDRKGNATTSDLRSSTFEEGRGRFFRFATTQYLDNAKGELTFGDAKRYGRSANSSSDSAGVNVRLKKPKPMKMKLGGKILFPTQHSREILKAAFAGRSLLQADIYDGSDDGEKVYLTSTFIGKVAAPKSPVPSAGRFRAVKDAQKLNRLKSWPVIISYYDKDDASDEAGEGLPSYELSYRLFANGVSRKLKIDYGDFSINGKLTKIKFLPPAPCR